MLARKFDIDDEKLAFDREERVLLRRLVRLSHLPVVKSGPRANPNR